MKTWKQEEGRFLYLTQYQYQYLHQNLGLYRRHQWGGPRGVEACDERDFVVELGA